MMKMIKVFNYGNKSKKIKDRKRYQNSYRVTQILHLSARKRQFFWRKPTLCYSKSNEKNKEKQARKTVLKPCYC